MAAESKGAQAAPVCKWFAAKEAKRARVAHAVGHARLGEAFTKCGKTPGEDVSRGVECGHFLVCLACAREIKQERERAAQSRAITAHLLNVGTEKA